MNVHEARVLEAFLQLRTGTDLNTGLLKGAIDFLEVPLETSTLNAAVRRDGVTVPILELNPATRLD